MNRNSLFFLGIAGALLLAVEARSETAYGYPKLKAGEWEMSVKNHSLPVGVPAALSDIKSIYCVDDATQERMLAQTQQASCEEPRVTRSGSTYVAEVTCNVQGITSHSRIETAFSGDDSFTSKIAMTSDKLPPTNMTSSGRWIGPCREGRKPGDIKIMNSAGVPFNLNDLEQLKELGGKMPAPRGR